MRPPYSSITAPSAARKGCKMLRALARCRCIYHAVDPLHALHLPGADVKPRPAPGEGRQAFSTTTTIAAVLASVQVDIGAPWWSVLIGSTLALRLALLPLSLQQARASAALGPTLQRARHRAGGPAAPTLAVVRHVLEYSRQAGSPHPAWIVAPLIVQLPTFVACMAAVTHLARDPALAGALASGGLLWFSDLTLPALRLSLYATHYACPMGLPGFALPIIACATAFTSLELRAARTELAGERLLRLALQWLTLPFFVAALQMPAAVFMYWIPNSLVSLGQVCGATCGPRLLALAPLAPPSCPARLHADALLPFVTVRSARRYC